jgi:hypothetical protein
MVDAAMLAAHFVPLSATVVIIAQNDPSKINLVCRVEHPSGGEFRVSVVFFGIEGDEVSLSGSHPDVVSPLLSVSSSLTTQAEGHACKAAVLQTFVWNRICAPALQ